MTHYKELSISDSFVDGLHYCIREKHLKRALSDLMKNTRQTHTSVCPQYTSVDSSSASSLAPPSGGYTSSQSTASALHSTHNSSNSSSSIGHLANIPNMSSTVGSITGASGLHSAATAASSTGLGLGSNGATATSNLSAPRTTPLLSSTGTHASGTVNVSWVVVSCNEVLKARNQEGCKINQGCFYTSACTRM